MIIIIIIINNNNNNIDNLINDFLKHKQAIIIRRHRDTILKAN